MAGGEEGWRRSGIEVSTLQFGYDGEAPLFARFDLRVAPGSRCLLVGANGSGKTTLLKILAGKHMVGGKDVVRVLNGSAFHDTQFVCSGDLSYLGGSWSRNVSSVGDVPLQGDFSAEHMIFGADGVDPVRREKLIDLLDIDGSSSSIQGWISSTSSRKSASREKPRSSTPLIYSTGWRHGDRHRVHPRGRAEKVREILGHRGAQDGQEPAVGRRVMAEVRDQAPEERSRARREPAQALLPV